MLFCLVQLNAQHKIGVRTGINYSNFIGGELEQGETYSYSNGFHFGINYTYQVTPSFGVRGELLYLQRGTKYNFTDTDEGVYNLIQPRFGASFPSFFENGHTILNIKISNGYISLPVTAQFQLTEKWEVFGGLSLDLLLNPTGRGTLDFTSTVNPDDIFFIQSLDHQYRSDDAGDVSFIASREESIWILVAGQAEEIIRTQSAYYKLTEDQKDGNKFKLFDSHAIFGFNYFINSGFYVGVRGHYGLRDITNDKLDFSVRELDASNGYIIRNDRDRSISFGASVGFRF